MTSVARKYAIYDLKKGQLVASISSEEVVYSEGNPEAEAVLKALMQREIDINEQQIDYDLQMADDDYEPYPEENMCYFNVVTLRPGDPSYMKAFLRRLPYISNYEARLSEE
jgi:hypothetical protein